MTRGQIIYKILDTKQKIKQHELNYTNGDEIRYIVIRTRRQAVDVDRPMRI